MRIYGNIMLDGDFFRGTIEIKEGIIENVWHHRKENYEIKGTVIPTFINMHTHIGDFYTQDEPKGSLEEIVGPGGYKYRVLRNRRKVYQGMRRAMKLMEKGGISHFVDFREGGSEGIELLLKASKGMSITPIILGRAKDMRAQGIGLSSLTDHPWELIWDMTQWARENKKIFAIHFSERIREDVDKLVKLKPHFVVHALKCTEGDLMKLKKENIAIVITPRANLFFGNMPDIPRLLKIGLTVALGTDNGMISLPSMFREMELAYKLSRLFGGVEPIEILKMVTLNPRKILGIKDNQIGEKARLIVFRRLMSPYELVNKSGVMDIRKIIF